MSCDRSSLSNPKTGRCKKCNGFTLSELKKLARSLRVSNSRYDTKADLCEKLLRATGGGRRRKSRSYSRKRKPASSTRRRKASRSYSRKKTTTRRKPARKSSTTRSYSRKKTTTRRKPARKSSSSSRRTTVSSRRKQLPRQRTYYRGRSYSRSSDSYPSTGTGSLQKRHFSSKRKGPSLPAQAHCGETARGNDGNWWQSRADKNGVCRWRKI